MNIDLSQNNHVVWGYNNKPWSKRTDLYDKFFTTYGTISRKPKNFRDEMIETAKQISVHCAKINKKPMVCFSGGLDSETVLCAFLESGVDFSVGHLQYTPDYNNHDTYWVRKFSNKYNLDLKIYQLDIIKFLSDEETFKSAKNNNARYITTELVPNLMMQCRDNYFPIIANGEPYLFREETNLQKPSRWIFKEFEYMMSWYNYAQNNEIESCPGFYQWSPEITVSFLLDPIMIRLVNNQLPNKITSRSSKYQIYKNAFPEYDLELRKKYTGHEKVSKLMLNDVNVRLNQLTKYNRNNCCSYEYYDFLKHQGYAN
jgi:hypothetical protein